MEIIAGICVNPTRELVAKLCIHFYLVQYLHANSDSTLVENSSVGSALWWSATQGKQQIGGHCNLTMSQMPKKH